MQRTSSGTFTLGSYRVTATATGAPDDLGSTVDQIKSDTDGLVNLLLVPALARVTTEPSETSVRVTETVKVAVSGVNVKVTVSVAVNASIAEGDLRAYVRTLVANRLVTRVAVNLAASFGKKDVVTAMNLAFGKSNPITALFNVFSSGDDPDDDNFDLFNEATKSGSNCSNPNCIVHGSRGAGDLFGPSPYTDMRV